MSDLFTLFLVCSSFSFSSCDSFNGNRDDVIPETMKVLEAEKDAGFLVNTAESYLREIAFGHLAIRKTGTKDIREMADELIKFKMKALQELNALASRKFISVPNVIPFSSFYDYMDLSEKKGVDFDQSYCRFTNDENKKTIREFKRIVKETDDEDIRTWAETALYALRVSPGVVVLGGEKQENNW